jgi:hypothetical protein
MEFQEFRKIPRLSREIVVTEKIDGTNAQIYIPYPEEILQNPPNSLNNDFMIFAGSRNRWISPGKNTDNSGFAQWVKENSNELFKLGYGRHYGEWWGKGIQRGYDLKEKRFSLFNTSRWNEENKPDCCFVVPVLFTGLFETEYIHRTLYDLKTNGSYASPGFMNPEGIVIYHIAGDLYFKKTIKNDESPKSMVKG